MQLRSGGKYYLYFVGNFMRFPEEKNRENLLRSDKFTADYKVVPFFSGHGVVYSKENR